LFNSIRWITLKGSSKAALITGAGKRLGKSMALFLAEKGFDIAVHYNSSVQEAKSTADQIQGMGRRAVTFQHDLYDIAETETFLSAVFREFPECRILVNSASIFQPANMMDTDIDIFERHMNINAKAPFFLMRGFARRVNTGQIVNILDTRITRTSRVYFIYSMTKKLLYEMTRSAARELAPGIRVNGIAPGAILPSPGQSEKEFQRMGKQTPLQRTGNPESIVKTLGYLIENNYVTGEVLFVDGGEQIL
jgi:NAD(P)-dependent dehydrogenase (short-subunit alcohol dehydrogenase family)